MPARKGSKRLPNKNIKNLNGRPLIEWTIEAAKNSRYIEEVLVSTNSEVIMEISEKMQASAPFKRPEELSTDVATTVEVLEHAIKFYEKKYMKEIENIILLQPTSPLRTSHDIDNAIQYYEEKGANGVISVSECDHSPLWANKLPEDMSLDNFMNDKYKNIRSQDLPTYYRLNGAIYIWNKKCFLEEKQYFLKEKTYAFLMNKKNGIDIDDELDFLIAQTIMKHNSNH
ncbi:acylneuraminate cytidylyltransferase family protein [Lysinibacillus capsici]|uniref:acylneuraminate cytidylyltransferase family protein n=1 Tax=Lysinibacillus capsici TaxID=2115968 RepID=UPI002449C3E8|nr:acylneuraminate cytidylyltransferase family protein [Lysinibacillus capsici]